MYIKRIYGQYPFIKEGFEIQHSGFDEATKEKEYVMAWLKK